MFFSSGHALGTRQRRRDRPRRRRRDGQHFVGRAGAGAVERPDRRSGAARAARHRRRHGVQDVLFVRARAGHHGPAEPVQHATTSVQIGYATSSDGFYWIRSPSNPAVAVGGSGWDADSHALAGRLGRAARRQVDQLGLRALLHDLPARSRSSTSACRAESAAPRAHNLPPTAQNVIDPASDGAPAGSLAHRAAGAHHAQGAGRSTLRR